MMSVTVVSAYYIVPSKHSHEKKYAPWIDNFMAMPFRSVIYVDSVSHAFLSAKYPETATRKYRLLDISDFTVAAAVDWKAETNKDPETTVGHSAPLYQIWNEKAHMVSRTIEENPYKTQWFAWVDIGCFRDSTQLTRFGGFPLVGTNNTVPPGKITMLQIEPFTTTDYIGVNTIDSRFLHTNRIGGTMFFGDMVAMKQFAVLHKETLAQFVAAEQFAGKDQSIYAFMVLRQPTLFNLVSAPVPTTATYDRWFYLHEYLSYAAARLRIAIVGPGIMPIPPRGWGAVEILIWDYAKELERLGHIVKIVNTRDHKQIVNEVRTFKPDFVHLQYDEHIACAAELSTMCRVLATTSHYGYLEQETRWQHDGYARFFHACQRMSRNCYVFALSEGIGRVHLKHGLPAENLIIAPNGANASLFSYTETPAHADRSIYLAKIDMRKRQAQLQDISGLWFAGNIADGRFNAKHSRYLGEWDKSTLYTQLTQYGNLVLLSDGEADPLVVKEALVAGLGIVVSECATASIDTTLPWITVIPESEMKNSAYVSQAIQQNRKIAVTMRRQIREYGLQFAWSVIVPRYVENIWKCISAQTLKN